MTSQSTPPTAAGHNRSFLFGGKHFPEDLLIKHLFFLGATGSGKSVSITLLLDVLRQIGNSGTVDGSRAAIYDAKLDTLSTLAHLGVTAPIIVANPFDTRSSAWRMCDDITSPASAYEMASTLFPGNPNSSQPFFDNAAQNLASGVFKALNLLSPRNWTFRHVCLILRSAQHLRELLSQSRHTRHLVERYLSDDGDSKLAQSILATVDSKLEPYLIIAALWDKASVSFSLQEFVRGESILLVGSFEEGREAIDALNRVLFRRLTQLLLAQPDSKTRRTYLIWDELREAGKLDGLGSVLLRGRSRGVAFIAGAQDKSGLAHVYGEDIANELLGQFGFWGILKLESTDTATWAASKFGSNEVVDTLGNTSRTAGAGRPSQSSGTSQSIRERANLLPSQILDLPPTSAEDGMHGFYKTPFGSFPAHVDFMPLLPPEIPLPDNYNFQLRDEQDQYLDDWKQDELTRFKLSPLDNTVVPIGKGPEKTEESKAEQSRKLQNIPERSHPFAGGEVLPE